MLQSALVSLRANEDLPFDRMSEAMDAIMAGVAAEEDVAEFLTLLHIKGETVDEIAAAAAALRRHMTPIRTSRQNFIDTCGTGGDGSATFNISTAAALVVAAAGVPVAKHGNRRITSRTGSADVLRELGVNIEADVACVERCLDELGVCFCFAPLLHSAMKHVAPIRQRLKTPTVFNLLGPLTNPARAPYQLLGVGRPSLRPVLAQALAILGTERSAVVCGADGLDEVTLAGPTHVSLAEHGETSESEWTPDDFGVQRAPLEGLTVSGPEESAAVIRRILAGEAGPARDIVILNAAAALWTARAEADLKKAAARAAEAIDSGAARELLARLGERSKQ